MCIIIHREQGSNVPNHILEYNRKKNPDGFGLAWRDTDGTLKHRKYSPGSYEQFHEMLKRLDKNPTIEYVAHYRFATHGPACERLSHPFPYTDEDGNEIVVFHNGVIPIATPREESDTSQFVMAVLAKLPFGWWNNNAMKFLVEGAVGYSRLLIMTKDETVRLNERAWTRQGGIYYSTDPGPSRSIPTAPMWGGKSNDSRVVKYEDKKHKKKHSTGWRATDDTRSTDGFTDSVDDDVMGWTHMGHWVESLDSENLTTGEDIACAAICTECNTMGEVYVIGGTTFIDVSHNDDAEFEDDESDLDALTMASVLLN